MHKYLAGDAVKSGTKESGHPRLLVIASALALSRGRNSQRWRLAVAQVYMNRVSETERPYQAVI